MFLYILGRSATSPGLGRMPLLFFLRFCLFIFRERRREGEREGEKHRAHNPGMCPDRDSNQQPFCSQAGAQFTEPGPEWPYIVDDV